MRQVVIRSVCQAGGTAGTGAGLELWVFSTCGDSSSCLNTCCHVLPNNGLGCLGYCERWDFTLE